MRPLVLSALLFPVPLMMMCLSLTISVSYMHGDPNVQLGKLLDVVHSKWRWKSRQRV